MANQGEPGPPGSPYRSVLVVLAAEAYLENLGAPVALARRRLARERRNVLGAEPDRVGLGIELRPGVVAPTAGVRIVGACACGRDGHRTEFRLAGLRYAEGRTREAVFA